MAESRSIHPKLALAVLIGVTALIYIQVIGFDFVNFDDSTYVTKNPAVVKGFSLEGVQWAFTNGVSGHWHPLTIISLMLDESVWGVGYAGGYHLTNLVLHLLNVGLVYLLFRKLLGPPLHALIIAALFALHPIHVESVAWISIRKDVLSQFFGLLSLIVYADYARGEKRGQAPFPPAAGYILALVFFALGLMSKAVLVTLPASMLLLDFWPLRRFEETVPADPLATPFGRVSMRKIVFCCVEKLPFFALSGMASWLTVHFMLKGKVLSDLSALPASLRLENGLISYVIYLRKLILPSDLGVQYTYPQHIPVWQWGGAIVLLLAITAYCVAQVRKRPYLLMGWLWYLGTIFPVSGVMQAGMQPMADRYAYLSFLGLYLVLTLIGAELATRAKVKTGIVTGGLLAGVIAMAALTFVQIGYWRDSMSLFARAVAIDDGNFLAHNNLGAQYRQAGDLSTAMLHFKRAHELSPALPAAIENIALTYQQGGDSAAAVTWYMLARKTDPTNAATPLNLGWALLDQNRPADAALAFGDAVRLDPDNVDPHMGLATAMGKLHRNDKADEEFNRVIAMSPDYFNARYNFGMYLFENKRYSDAAVQFRFALRIAPDNQRAREYLDRCAAGK